MDNKTYVFSDLRKKYNNFLEASVSVYVSGKVINEGFLIEDVMVENTVLAEETGGALIKVRRTDSIYNSYDNEELLSAFPLMAKLKIEMGYQDRKETVFEGLIYERSFTLTSEYDTSLSITGVDYKALFRLNNTYSTFQNVKSYSNAVSTIMSAYPVKTVIDQSETFAKPTTLSQYGLSDFDYIQKLAASIGYEFFALFGDVYFRKARNIKAILMKFEQADIRRLEHRTSMNHILSEITMLTHDQDKNESKPYTCNTVQDKVGSGLTGGEILKNNRISAAKYDSRYTNKRIVRNYQEIAACLLQENSMELTELTFLIDGIPQMIPGRFVKLEKVSKCVDNTYYIKKVTHSCKNNVYRTEVFCCSNTSKF